MTDQHDSSEAPIMPHRRRCPSCGSTNVVRDRYSLDRTRGNVDDTGLWYRSYLTIHSWHYDCRTCHLHETATDERREDAAALHKRWEDARAPITWADIDKMLDESARRRDEAERAYTWPPDPKYAVSEAERDAWHAERSGRLLDYPEHPELLAEVVRRPDDDEPRLAFAAWLREQSSLSEFANTAEIATYIEAAVRAANVLRDDPKADVLELFRTHPHLEPDPWGVPGYGSQPRRAVRLMEPMATDTVLYRGFVEHVAMKAKYFLAHADELYRRAPIRHLTLTYCPEVIEALADSPHLERIRSLELPNKLEDNPHTRLNNLRDEHVKVLAASRHLGKLAWLSFEDGGVAPRGYDYLAMSPFLTSLSYVQQDIYDYNPRASLSGNGALVKRLGTRPLVDYWAAELEQRHGYLPWLHAEEHYGTSTPDRQRVVSHPVGDATFRPDIAARRRPQLPIELIDAIVARIDVATFEVRDRALIAVLPGGRLVATIERAEIDPQIADGAAHVTLTVQQAPSTPLVVYDYAVGRAVTAGTRATVTVRVPTFL